MPFDLEKIVTLFKFDKHAQLLFGTSLFLFVFIGILFILYFLDSKPKAKTEITKTRLLNLIGIYSSKYYEWVNREGQPNKHNGIIPKLHWILP